MECKAAVPVELMTHPETLCNVLIDETDWDRVQSSCSGGTDDEHRSKVQSSGPETEQHVSNHLIITWWPTVNVWVNG